MIYGLYLSATGVLSNSYRQDVIANNIANAETVGFKRTLAVFQQRRPESQSLGQPDLSNSMLDHLGGGMLAAPGYVDQTPGPPEATGNKLDLMIEGNGYFAIQDRDQTFLTRNGKFMLDRNGYLILANGSGNRVLDANQKPIRFGTDVPESQITIRNDGEVSVGTEGVARIGLFDVPNVDQLSQRGGTLLSYPDTKDLKTATGTVKSGFIEASNVDPMTELTQLINAQRQLEANANMIRYQDETLGKLVTDVGKIS